MQSAPSVVPAHDDLTARYDAARRAERDAHDDLVDRGIANTAAYDAFMAAAQAVVDARGALFAGRTWTQDGRPAVLTEWCPVPDHPDHRTMMLFERYDGDGERISHGSVCECCRRVTQIG